MLFCPIWLFPCYEQQNKATSKIFFSAGKKGCLEKLCSSVKIFLFWQLLNSIWHGIFPGHIVLQVLFCSWLQQRLLSFPLSFWTFSETTVLPQSGSWAHWWGLVIFVVCLIRSSVSWLEELWSCSGSYCCSGGFFHLILFFHRRHTVSIPEWNWSLLGSICCIRIDFPLVQ